MTEYEFHPVCLAFPGYDPDVYAKRKADYERHPERAGDSAVLIAQDEADGSWKIADGRHHYLICKELGYECDFQRFAGTPEELAELVLYRNAHRRHCEPSQIAAAIVAIQRWAHGGGFRGNQHTSGKSPRGDLPTQKQAAKSAGVGKRTVERANKVAKKAPEVLPAVRDGKLDANTAAKVADLPAETRKAIVEAKDPKQAAVEALEAQAEEDAKPDPGAEFVGAVESLCRDIDQVVRRMKELKGDPRSYSMHIDSAVSQVEAARKTLWQGRPAHPCPYCEGKGCKACNETGRVKKTTYDSGREAVGGVE